MKLATMTRTLERKFGLKKAIKMLKDAGFDAYDCSLGYAMTHGEFSGDDALEKAQEIRKYSDELGISCVQTHTPSHASDIKGMEYFLAGIDVEKKAVEISGILGAEVAVVHPTSLTDAEGNYDMLYSKLLPIAKKYGLKIATENMFAWKDKRCYESVPTACGYSRDFVRQVDVTNDENMVACLDIGHCHLPNNEKFDVMVKALGNKRLKALHVNDNDLWDDLHVFPFFGGIDWDYVCKTLAEIDYSGNFTFETDLFMDKYPDELIPECLTLLEKTGRYLIDKINEYKAK